MGFDAGGSSPTEYHPNQLDRWKILWADVRSHVQDAQSKQTAVAFQALTDPASYFGLPTSVSTLYPYGSVRGLDNWNQPNEFLEMVSSSGSKGWVPERVYIDLVRSKILSLYDEWKEGRGVSEYVDQLTRRHSEILREEYFENLAPQVKQGFRDANAVQSSCFLITLGQVWSKYQRSVSDFDGKVRLEAFMRMKDHEVQLIATVFSQEGSFAQVGVELERLKALTAFDRTKLEAAKKQMVSSFRIALADAAWQGKSRADIYKGDALVASYKWKSEIDKTWIAAQSSLSGGTAGYHNAGINPLQAISAGISAGGSAASMVGPLFAGF